MRRSRKKYPDEEDNLAIQLELAGWRVGSAYDDAVHLVRCGDLIQPRDGAAARALFQAQLGAPVDIRGEKPRDVWWIYFDQLSGAEYYFPLAEKPRSREAPPTFPIERTIIGDGFWVERSLVQPLERDGSPQMGASGYDGG